MKTLDSHRIIVLGAASWLGYLLLKKLNEINMGFILAGVFHHQKIAFDFNLKLYQADRLEDYDQILKDFSPTVIVNFLRGERPEDLIIHKAFIDYCKIYDSYYLYASSALALDGYKNALELKESHSANADTPYGIFKAHCEYELYDFPGRWCIIRFASVQGWIPHKATRNELFLKRLADGQKIIVDRGVFQNRMIADVMIDGISKLILNQIEGIIHFGTIDSSEEILFLKEQAKLFGYSADLIRDGKERNVNLVTVPERIFKLFGDSYRLTEHDTLTKLLTFSGLQRYIKH